METEQMVHEVVPIQDTTACRHENSPIKQKLALAVFKNKLSSLSIWQMPSFFIMRCSDLKLFQNISQQRRLEESMSTACQKKELGPGEELWSEGPGWAWRLPSRRGRELTDSCPCGGPTTGYCSTVWRTLIICCNWLTWFINLNQVQKGKFFMIGQIPREGIPWNWLGREYAPVLKTFQRPLQFHFPLLPKSLAREIFCWTLKWPQLWSEENIRIKS